MGRENGKWEELELERKRKPGRKMRRVRTGKKTEDWNGKLGRIRKNKKEKTEWGKYEDYEGMGKRKRRPKGKMGSVRENEKEETGDE